MNFWNIVGSALENTGKAIKTVGSAVEWAGKEPVPGCGFCNATNVARQAGYKVYQFVNGPEKKPVSKERQLTLRKILNGELVTEEEAIAAGLTEEERRRYGVEINVTPKKEKLLEEVNNGDVRGDKSDTR